MVAVTHAAPPAAAPQAVGEWLESLAPVYSEADRKRFAAAYEMARESVGAARSADGEPLLVRALGTAGILAAQRLDADSLTASLLLGLPEAGARDAKRVEAAFGPGVATLVAGVARMDSVRALAASSDAQRAEQAENLRKMLLAMVDDIRVVLIKLAERTQALRYLMSAAGPSEGRPRERGEAEARRARPRALTAADTAVRPMPNEDKEAARNSAPTGGSAAAKPQAWGDVRAAGPDVTSAAREVMDVYAPLANRLGVWQLKWELEDLSLRALEPEDLQAHRAAARRAPRSTASATSATSSRRSSASSPPRASRPRSPAGPSTSTASGARCGARTVGIDALYDVRAVRVLVDDGASDCYTALGIVHHLWTPLPGEFDDYIASPRPTTTARCTPR